MAEEAPPPAFYMESNPRSIYMPPQSFHSVQAEVFEEFEPVVQSPKSKHSGNSFSSSMSPIVSSPPLYRNAIHMPNSAAADNLKPAAPVSPVEVIEPMAQLPIPSGMDLGILSQDFMKNMLDMAVSMDMDQMNQMNRSMQHDLQSLNHRLDPQQLPNLPPQGMGMDHHRSEPHANNHNYQIHPSRRKHQHSMSNPNPFQNLGNLPFHVVEAPKFRHSEKPKAKVQRAPKVQKAQKVQKQKRDHPQRIDHNPRPQQEFRNPVQRELVSMGFDREYVVRSRRISPRFVDGKGRNQWVGPRGLSSN